MADPTVIECSSACTVTVEFTTPVLNLSTDEAAALAVPILLVWAAGWAFRMVIKTMNQASGSGSGDSE